MVDQIFLNPRGLGERIFSLRREVNALHGHPEATPLRTSLDRLQDYVAMSAQTDSFKCFMVDFLGVGGVDVLSLEDAVALAEKESPAKKLPTLYSVVEEWLNSVDACVTDRGYGISAWHLGAYCTPGEAWWLARQARTQFDKTCKAGLLRIEIQPWSMERTS